MPMALLYRLLPQRDMDRNAYHVRKTQSVLREPRLDVAIAGRRKRVGQRSDRRPAFSSCGRCSLNYLHSVLSRSVFRNKKGCRRIRWSSAVCRGVARRDADRAGVAVSLGRWGALNVLFLPPNSLAALRVADRAPTVGADRRQQYVVKGAMDERRRGGLLRIALDARVAHRSGSAAGSGTRSEAGSSRP